MDELTDDNFFEKIEVDGTVLIDFFASWCGGCRMAGPMFERVAKEKGVEIYKIDVEKNQKIKEMINLPGLPTIGIFKKGEPVDMINTTKEEAFLEFLDKNLP